MDVVKQVLVTKGAYNGLPYVCNMTITGGGKYDFSENFLKCEFYTIENGNYNFLDLIVKGFNNELGHTFIDAVKLADEEIQERKGISIIKTKN